MKTAVSTFVAAALLASPASARPKANATTPATVHCTSDAPCPLLVARTIDLEANSGFTSLSLGRDGTGYMSATVSGSVDELRSVILEIREQEPVRRVPNAMPFTHVRTDASGSPVLVDRPWASVLLRQGWLDGSHPRTVGDWSRHLVEADVRGLERLQMLDTALDPEGHVIALFGSRETTGQFPLIVAQSEGESWHAEVAEARPYLSAAAMDLDPQGRIFIARATHRQGDPGTKLVVGPLGQPPTTVLGPPEGHRDQVRWVDLLAPTETRPAMLSLASQESLRLARIGPQGEPFVRSVPQLRVVESTEPYEKDSVEQTFVTAHLDDHVLLPTPRHVVLAWLSTKVDRTVTCSTETTQVGPVRGCATTRDDSREQLHVARVTEDLTLADIITLTLPAVGAQGLAGAVRGDQVALAVARPGVAVNEVDYVVLSMK